MFSQSLQIWAGDNAKAALYAVVCIQWDSCSCSHSHLPPVAVHVHLQDLQLRYLDFRNNHKLTKILRHKIVSPSSYKWVQSQREVKCFTQCNADSKSQKNCFPVSPPNPVLYLQMWTEVAFEMYPCITSLETFQKRNHFCCGISIQPLWHLLAPTPVTAGAKVPSPNLMKLSSPHLTGEP